MKPRALVLAPMRGPEWDRLRELIDVHYDPAEHRPHPPEHLARRLSDVGARILITESDEVEGPVLDLPLLVVGCARGDAGNVDLRAATERGIPVVCAPGRDADAIAELTLALILAVNRRVVVGDREIRQGMIPYQRHRAWELAGRTVCLVGHGPVGRAVAWRMRGLGTRVMGYDPEAADNRYGLDVLLAQADVVSLHAPASAGPLIGAAEFAAMKPGAIFVNTANAALHDMDALVGALKTGHLGGAALDRFDGEWLSPAHPLVGMDNVVLTPNLGAGTYDTEVNHTRMICEDIVRILGGERPLHCVNPDFQR
ncbi:D-3-phosphoglycerate dehydrogenase SerA [Streptosporangium fragile]|uniref:D-3-phosphoglycerate dehydrogenase SerA n=1 Tax=Streptosporangium fragile TaxID=46186 RepID=A0ABP6IM96_9ACTN